MTDATKAARSRLMTHQQLIDRVTECCLSAIEAGMEREEVSAVLAKVQELLDQEDE